METLVTLKVSVVLCPIMTEIETKQRIQLAAHQLVMQYGIRSVSMDDIASNLGMSKKTIYQYFKDKDEFDVFCKNLSTTLFSVEFFLPSFDFDVDDC